MRARGLIFSITSLPERAPSLTVIGAALLPVEVGEHRAFFGNMIDVRRAVTHDTVIVATDVKPADVVGHDEKNVRFFCSDFAFRSFFSLFLYYRSSHSFPDE